MTPRRPLTGRSVVVCRAVGQSDELVASLRSLGAEVVRFPLLETAPPNDGGARLDAELARLDRYDWIVFTSTNAVDAVAARRPGPLPAGLGVAVVGPATARSVRQRGWAVDMEPTESTATVLAAELAVGPGTCVLAPLAELAASALTEGLSARGADVTRVDAYRTIVPVHPAETVSAATAADAVLLTSPSIAERFAAVAGTSVPHVIAIGPSTAAAAERSGFVVSAVADPHTETGLIAALVSTITA